MRHYNIRYTIKGATNGETIVVADGENSACMIAERVLNAKYGRFNWCVRAIDVWE